MADEVKREVVSLGLDFSPIPVDLGDGKVWNFTPDPEKDQWKTLTDTLKSIAKYRTLQDDDFDDLNIDEIITSFTHAIAALLVEPKQQKEWVARAYGLLAQQKTAKYLMEEWSGFPTNQPKPSGKGSKKTG